MKRLPVLVLALLAIWSSPALADRASRRSPVVEVVEKVSPAVVFIGTRMSVEPRFRHPLDRYFEDYGRDSREAESLGSGVIIDPSGIIITNEHVIRGASSIHVVLADGRQLDAEVTGSDADNDLAILQVRSKGPLPAATLGSDEPMIGESVIAIGSPFGLSKTVTQGVISATGRSFRAQDKVYNDFLQTDASINPGNSGGPLLNVDGEVVGINSAIFSGAQGIGFAIPADKVRRIVQELKEYGKRRPAWVGAEVAQLPAQVARRLGWDRTYGAVIAEIEEDSPAAKAGLQKGDIVAEMGGSRVTDAEDYEVRLNGYPARSAVRLKIFRGGRELELSLTPVEFPPARAEQLAWDRLGLRFRAVKGALQVTAVRPGTAAARTGLQPGDLVVRLNNAPLTSMELLRDGLLAARAQRSVLLVVVREQVGYYLTLPF